MVSRRWFREASISTQLRGLQVDLIEFSGRKREEGEELAQMLRDVEAQWFKVKLTLPECSFIVRGIPESPKFGEFSLIWEMPN